MPNKVGRPPKKAKERRATMFSIKLTAEELKAFEKAAGDQPVSVWARNALRRIAKLD